MESWERKRTRRAISRLLWEKVSCLARFLCSALRANTTQSIIIIILAHADRDLHAHSTRAFFHADCCNLRLFSTTFNLYTHQLGSGCKRDHSLYSSRLRLFGIRCAQHQHQHLCAPPVCDWEFIYFLRAHADVLIYFKRMNAANVTQKWALYAVISRHSKFYANNFTDRHFMTVQSFLFVLLINLK